MKYSKLLKKNEVLILLFHGVVKKKYSKILDPASKHVTVKRFESIIRDLNSKGEPISLKKFFRLKKLKKKSFIITFDDGFYNNLLALKILKKFKVPATFYITTNFVKNNLMSWVDMIDYAVNKTKRKKINILNNNFNLTGEKNKIEFQKKIRIIVKNSMNIDENILAKKIQKKLIGKIVNTSNLEIYKKLSWEDIVKINSNDLFNIGLHSHNHEILTKLSDKKLKRTIALSKNLLRKFTNISTDLFAYPDGQSNHYSKKVIKVLKKYGFLSSPTAIEGHNKLSSNKFRLRRFFAT